jgi:hypothetical protein
MCEYNGFINNKLISIAGIWSEFPKIQRLPFDGRFLKGRRKPGQPVSAAAGLLRAFGSVQNAQFVKVQRDDSVHSFAVRV